MEDYVLEVELARESTAPRVARTLLRERFGNELSHDALDTASLLVSELVTNAVRHGHGRIMLRAHLNGDRLLVEVIDEGTGLEPAIRERDFEDPRGGGRGLMVVDAESSRWGIHEGPTHVWFELERHRAPGSPPATKLRQTSSCSRQPPARPGSARRLGTVLETLVGHIEDRQLLIEPCQRQQAVDLRRPSHHRETTLGLQRRFVCRYKEADSG